jgi:hypothetical protein
VVKKRKGKKTLCNLVKLCGFKKETKTLCNLVQLCGQKKGKAKKLCVT